MKIPAAYRGTLAITAIAGLVVPLSACVPNENNADHADGSGPIEVTITDDRCDIPVKELKAGTHHFTLKNEGTVRNEFEILADDKLRIVGERENLGPGTVTEYTIILKEGEYFTACKKNMLGDLVDVRPLKVTAGDGGDEVNADEQKLIDEAVKNYTAYVRDQAEQLLAATEKFVNIYTAGKVEEAKELYPRARAFYERIEPTAEAFGDIDAALDLREADWQEEKDGSEWTGWHVVEKDLWRPAGYTGLKPAQQKKIADKLVKDTKRLTELVRSKDFSIDIDEISNGAIALLEEVATTKLTGEEEAFSHTDLYDFHANVEGAKVAYGNVEQLAKQKDPELAKNISQRFDAVMEELEKYREGSDGFRSYDKVSEKERKALSDKVNALRRPLAKLTGAIVK